MCSTEKNVSLKELRENFYKLRSFEISNLWQRSIFLTAIIVLLFTGYGCLLSEIVREGTDVLLINEICCGISIIGLSFSFIWIMMAKGSKAWFEIYERRICEIEDEKELNIQGKYSMMNANAIPYSLSNNLFNSTTSGAYSVSKLNILIGIILAFVWIFAFAFHYIGILQYLQYLNWLPHFEAKVPLFFVCFFPFLLLLIIVIAFKNYWAKSSTIGKLLN